MPTLWARTVSFESINPGDQLPIVIKWETVESIQRFQARAAPDLQNDLREDSGEDSDAAPALPWSVLVAYVKELLAKAFPPESIDAPASRLDLKLIAPVRAEDTISLSGKVVSKGVDGLVECEIVIENHRQETIGLAAAVVNLATSGQAASSQEAI
jgi:hypothetical protein